MLRLTEQQYQAIQRSGTEAAPRPQPARADLFAGMNKTEQRYAQLLESRKASGEIVDWKFEAFNLQLAKPNKATKQKGTYYRTDFLVITDCLEIHEVKGGFIRDDADLKFKIAREMYPWFRFVMMQFKKNEWRRIR